MSKKLMLGLCFMSLLLCSSGCVLLLGATAGAGSYAFVKGKLEQNFAYPIKKVHQASLKALKDLDIMITDDDIGFHEAKILAEYDDGKSLRLDIEALTEMNAKVRIRVGVFGDEMRSREVLNAIEKQL